MPGRVKNFPNPSRPGPHEFPFQRGCTIQYNHSSAVLGIVVLLFDGPG
jgi:hypothetical protein